jgi:hypothetical protein
MAKLTPDQLSMFSQMTSGTSTNAISSQESQDGLTLSDLQSGQTTEKSGRAAARASRSALQEKVKELTMSGIYGRTFFDSLEAVAPQSSWVSKLQVRLGMVGSTESDLIWKVKATPSKASIFRLAVSTARTSVADFTGSQATWKTPLVMDASNDGIPRALRYKGNAPSEEGNSRPPELMGSYRGELKDFVGHLYPEATWRTPNTRDGMQSGYADMEKLANRWERGKQVQLCDQVRMEHSTWSTPTLCGNYNRKGASATSADGLATQVSGIMPSGSTAPTEKRGALNPTFVCWLMGFPPEWESCAPTAMPSSRRSRQKS